MLSDHPLLRLEVINVADSIILLFLHVTIHTYTITHTKTTIPLDANEMFVIYLPISTLRYTDLRIHSSNTPCLLVFIVSFVSYLALMSLKFLHILCISLSDR